MNEEMINVKIKGRPIDFLDGMLLMFIGMYFLEIINSLSAFCLIMFPILLRYSITLYNRGESRHWKRKVIEDGMSQKAKHAVACGKLVIVGDRVIIDKERRDYPKEMIIVEEFEPRPVPEKYMSCNKCNGLGYRKPVI